MKNRTFKQKTQKIFVLFFGLALLLTSAANVVFAQDITLSWDANQESDVAFYNIIFIDVETQETWQEPGPAHDPSTSVVSHQILGLDGTRQYCFKVTALNDSGVESSPSEEICTTAPAAVTNVTLSEAIGTGGTFNYTAAAIGGSSLPEYRFWLKDPTAGWSVQQAYSANALWSWDPTGLPEGTYFIQVDARSQGSSARREAALVVRHVITGPLQPSVTLTETTGGGGIFGYTAAASGLSGTPEYRFWLKDPITGWSVQQAYSANALWNWDPTRLPGGTYVIQVDARGQGSTARWEAALVVRHVIIGPQTPPLPSVTLTETTGAGETFDYTAAASDLSGTPEYRFWLKDPTAGWSIQQAYSANALWNWDPTGLPEGTYFIQVDARGQDSTVRREAALVVRHVIP